MIKYAISPRYAKVLFDLDSAKSNLDRRLEDFDSVINIFNQNPQLVRFLKAPHIILKDKKKVLWDSLKEKFDPIFINFLSYLIQKGRLGYLASIGNAYRLLVNEDLERWEADIITAVPLDADSEGNLVKKLEKMFHKKIKLKNKIDPKIIGGAILVISNEMLDWSVTGRLRKLKEKLTATQV